MSISETWLADCIVDLVDITGYNFVSNHHKSKTGGVIDIYLPNDLQYIILNNCKLSDLETIKYFFRGNYSSLWEKKSLLDVCIGHRIKILPSFVHTLFLHAFIPQISNPTCLTSYSATLINNIFTNNLSQSPYRICKAI